MARYGTDVIDFRTADIVPSRTLRDSSNLLGHQAALRTRLDSDGYLFFGSLLDRAAIARTRRHMLAPLVAAGLASDDSDAPRWTGGDRANLAHTDPAFDGICAELFASPAILASVERVLGEPVSLVPMAQYRAYRPDPTGGFAHQDGFFSPGIRNYLPLWIPLVPMDEAMGGLALAVGMTGRGFFHNEDKPTPFPMPAQAIPADAWARTDYAPGDLLVVHPETPHAGLPNRSDRIRLSLDTRVQSAANPSTLVGAAVAVGTDFVELACEDGRHVRLSLDDQTFIRTEHPTQRMSRDEFAARTQLGRRLLASFDGPRAVMLRQADR